MRSLTSVLAALSCAVALGVGAAALQPSSTNLRGSPSSPALYGAAPNGQVVGAATIPLGNAMPDVQINREAISVSGISAGAFQAVQLHVAFSGTFNKGLAVIAGGAYWCAQDSVEIALGPCMSDGQAIDVSYLQTIARSTAFWGFADPLENLSGTRVWVLSAQQDTVVDTEVVKKLEEWYTSFVTDPSAISGVYNVSGEHSQLTLNYGNPCTTLSEPYLNSCSFDAAGAGLQWIYNDQLNQPVSGPTGFTGQMYSFNQGWFLGEPGAWDEMWGLNQEGYVYVPQACANGTQACDLHVALHGCLMSIPHIGEQYIRYAGYNRWADVNSMVVLYPQFHTTPLNPKACADWFAYTGTAYASNIGTQPLAIKRMIDQLLGQPWTANATVCSTQYESARHAGTPITQAERLDRCWPSGGLSDLQRWTEQYSA